MLHPEVQKYLQKQRSLGGKTRWAKIPKADRAKELAPANAGRDKYWAEYRKRKWSEQFED